MEIPQDHPRSASLTLRHKLTDGLSRGIVAEAGLIAHGRGEAFDYLLAEKTHKPAYEAEKAATALLKGSKSPVISVNGNTAVLCPKEIVELAKATYAKIEVNLFYRSPGRLKAIEQAMQEAGAEKVYGVDVAEPTIPGLSSERAKSDKAILEADTVLVMLEDGDRTEKLKMMGKKVIAIDLNPLSRTPQMADISIIDNVVRALPNMVKMAGEIEGDTKAIVRGFSNEDNLAKMEKLIRDGQR